jgi:hypothetical protein
LTAPPTEKRCAAHGCCETGAAVTRDAAQALVSALADPQFNEFADKVLAALRE